MPVKLRLYNQPCFIVESRLNKDYRIPRRKNSKIETKVLTKAIKRSSNDGGVLFRANLCGMVIRHA